MTKTQWLSKKDTKNKRPLSTPVDDNDARPRALLPPGILNSANDCFANSVLQSLIATPMLEDMILFRPGSSADPALSPALCNGRQAAGLSEVEWTDGLKLSDTFLDFMENAYLARRNRWTHPLNPRNIIRTLGCKFNQYLDFRQQDAHELLRHLLDAMDMDELDIIKKRQLQPVSTHDPARTELTPKLKSFSSTVFGGRLASFIVCNTCKHISHTYEDFLDLSIPIKAEDAKKKGAFRAFAEKFISSLQATGSSSAQPSRPGTPNLSGPKISEQSINIIDSSLVHPQSPPSTSTPAPALPLASSHLTPGVDHVSPVGRSISNRFSRSKERNGYIARQGAGGEMSRSRPTSVDARSRPSAGSRTGSRTSDIRKSYQQKKRVTKPTPGEAAYLRALLRDEPSHQSYLNLNNLLRGGVGTVPSSAALSLVSPSSAVSPPSSDQARALWGRIGSSTTSVLDCLRMFTSVEILEGDNSFACHNCWKIANPDEAHAERRWRRYKRRRRREKDAGVVRFETDSSSTQSDADSDSSDSEDENEVGPEGEVYSKWRSSSKHPRPDLVNSRTLSADDVLNKDAVSLSFTVGHMEPPSIDRVSLRSEPNSPNLRAELPLATTPLPTEGYGSTSSTGREPLPQPPFPTIHIPTISMSAPSPIIAGLTTDPPPTTARAILPLYSQSRHRRDPASARVNSVYRPSASPQGDATDTDTDGDVDDDRTPRFRRFSSFHAEKFLSPNVSSESLASAPADEGLFSLIRRRRKGLSGDAETSNENAIATDDEESEAENADNINGSAGRVQLVSSSLVPEHASMLDIGKQQLLLARDDARSSADTAILPAPIESPSSVPSSAQLTVIGPGGTRASSDVTPVFTDNRDVEQAVTFSNTPNLSLPENRTKRSEQVVLRQAFKRYLIDVPPPILVIHLKRFQQIHHNFSGKKKAFSSSSSGSPSPYPLLAGSAKKLEDYVSFSEILDLRPFLAPKKETFGLDKRGRTPRSRATEDFRAKRRGVHGYHHWGWSDTQEEDGDSPVLYRLYAVVVHIGSMLGGHYIVYTAVSDMHRFGERDAEDLQVDIRRQADSLTQSPEQSKLSPRSMSPQPNSQSGPSKRQWCYVSDTTVRLASMEEVMKSKAYLLFYEKLPQA